jgi:hypothetical protein
LPAVGSQEKGLGGEVCYPTKQALGTQPKQDFVKELEKLINRYSEEKLSNTPDFILAQYLSNALMAFNAAVQAREKWYGRKTF